MNKKGFTLIELLAVIVVLAVVAIIAIPSILGVIEKSRKAAYKDSVYGIIDSARLYLASNIENYNENDEIEFVCDGKSCSNDTELLGFKGSVPKSGSVYIKGDGSILVESLYNGRYYANNETGEVVITEEDTTMTRGELTDLVKELQKENTGLKNKINEIVTKNSTQDSQISNVDKKINDINSKTKSKMSEITVKSLNSCEWTYTYAARSGNTVHFQGVVNIPSTYKTWEYVQIGQINSNLPSMKEFNYSYNYVVWLYSGSTGNKYIVNLVLYPNGILQLYTTENIVPGDYWLTFDYIA